MYSLETIRSMNAATTERRRRRPVKLADDHDVDRLFKLHEIQLPHLGYAVEDVEAEELDVLFCDMSGWGRPDEPALTQAGFERRVTELLQEHGPLQLAVGEAGQFQAYVHVWKA